jgi:hypothetical protein
MSDAEFLEMHSHPAPILSILAAFAGYLGQVPSEFFKATRFHEDSGRCGRDGSQLLRHRGGIWNQSPGHFTR